MSGLLDELRQAVPGDAVLTDRDLLRTYEHDEADLCGHGTPLAVVRPRHTADVAAVLRLAAAHRVPVVPQGARTGLAGAANAVDGAIILSLIGMNEIVEIDAAERVAVVQLGVVTELTLRLRPAATEPLTLVAVFPTTAAAGAAVAAITASGSTPSLLELIDQTFLRAIEAYGRMGLDTSAQALLLAASDAGVAAPAELDLMATLCRNAGAAEVYVAGDPAEAHALLQARRLAHPSMERFAAAMFPGGNGGVIIDDVAVPRRHLVEMIDGIGAVAAEYGVTIGVVGHAGDGNLHPNIVVDRSDPSSVERGGRAFDAIMALGLRLGGTCTGEHGVGLLKREWLARELGPVGMRVHRAIKDALDPAGILNPGKVL